MITFARWRVFIVQHFTDRADDTTALSIRFFTAVGAEDEAWRFVNEVMDAVRSVPGGRKNLRLTVKIVNVVTREERIVFEKK